MLFSYGKIKRIKGDDIILSPTLDKEMDFYNGQYFLEENVTLTGSDYHITLEPGFLEVFTTSGKFMNDEKSFFINYKLTTTNGLIYIWRFYVDKTEEVVVHINKDDRPNLLLTLRSLGKLSYTREEMEDRFLLRHNSHLDDSKYFIGLPEVTRRQLYTSPDISKYNLFNSNFDFYENETIEKFTLMKDLEYNNFYNIGKDKKAYIDYNTHPEQEYEKWTDLFQSDPNWSDKYTNNKKISDSDGFIFPSIRKTYGVWPLMNYLHVKLGEYFIDVSLPITNKQHILKISNNTYLPFFNFKYKSLGRDFVSIKESYHSIPSPLLMSRLFSTPDKNLKTKPIIHYAHNVKPSHYVSGKYDINIEDMKNRDIELEFKQDKDKVYRADAAHIYPIMYNSGILSTSVVRKKDPINLFQMKKEIKYSPLINEYIFNKYFKKVSWSIYLFPGVTPSNSISNPTYFDIFHQLFDLDPTKSFYQSFSETIENLNYHDRFLQYINDNYITEDIRLGPEIRKTYDFSEINLTEPSKRTLEFNLVDNNPALALTYFKPEINKRSSRYRMNPGSLYDPAYPEQEDFLDRITRKRNLRPDEKLAIDKITIGFRPIQIKEQGTWKNINMKGEYAIEKREDLCRTL